MVGENRSGKGTDGGMREREEEERRREQDEGERVGKWRG